MNGQVNLAVVAGDRRAVRRKKLDHMCHETSVIKRRERKQVAGGCREDHLYKVLNHAVWCYIT